MDIKNTLLKNSKGILCLSPKGNSEYAEAGKRLVYELSQQPIPLSWKHLIIDETSNDETDTTYQIAKKVLNKNINFDTAIFQCDPEEWYKHIEKFRIKFLRKKLIGYPIWETDRILNSTAKHMNSMDEIWVPSKFNKSVFEKCGVSVPIKIIPIPFIYKSLPEVNHSSLKRLLDQSKWYGNNSNIFRYGSDWKIFYTIGELNYKDNVECSIEWFCNSFTIKDKVKLIVNTFYKDHFNKNINYCISRVEDILKKFKNHPEILLITSELSDQDILFLHSIGDCYYSCRTGGGVCINTVDALNYKKDVITPNFGGTVEYLKCKGLIECELANVYSGNQRWGNPLKNSAIDNLKEVYLKPRNQLFNPSIVLNRGWFFKEKINGKEVRRSLSNCNISFKSFEFDYVKLRLYYDNGEHSKNLFVLIDSTVKKTYPLIRGILQDIIIPINGVRNIELSTSSVVSSNDYLLDNKDVGIILEHVSLIKGNCIDLMGMDEICVENELSNFCSLISSKKDSENVSQEIIVSENNKKVKTNSVKIDIGVDSEFSGITYFGQYGTCGYATAAKGNLVYFFKKGIPITWNPLYFDNSELSNECFYNAMVKSLIKKPIDFYDTVFIHSTPDTWNHLKLTNEKVMEGKKIIGYTVWETNKLPSMWVNSINENVDEVWCPSTYNKNVFKNSGVKTPIKIFPHVFLEKELPKKESVNLKFYNGELIDENKYFTFYNISELNPRKGVEDLVKSFCEAFTLKSKVRLILKVHYKNYEEKNKRFCLDTLTSIISNYKNSPKIYFVLDNLSEQEILGLHSIGDCYVSLCKSEGFGLTIFEAFKYGRKVITTGYGGQIDFLGKNYEGLVKFKMGSIPTQMSKFSKYYSEDQQWAYPDLEHARDLMVLAAK